MNVFSIILGVPLCLLFSFLAVKLFIGLVRDIKNRDKIKVVSDKVDNSDGINGDEPKI